MKSNKECLTKYPLAIFESHFIVPQLCFDTSKIDPKLHITSGFIQLTQIRQTTGLSTINLWNVEYTELCQNGQTSIDKK